MTTRLSWHQARAASLHAMPYDVVGYIYRAATWCGPCVIDALPTGPGEAFDGWAIAPGADPVSPEDNLRELAAAFGIDQDREDTYDSDEFPKVIFRDMLADGDVCDGCGGEL